MKLKEKNKLVSKSKTLSVIFWLLSAVCMGVIFYLSSHTASQSSSESSAVLDWLIKIFGNNFFTSFIVRKAAHCLEFTGLALLLSTALLFSTGKSMGLYSFALTSLYALSDEFHQLFVAGRSCEVRDWLIDTAGALIGVTVFNIILFLILAIIKKRKYGKSH